jgi:D-tyrosyl-tRNA(Tyr) deacylase
MKAIVQRILEASVSIDGNVVGEIATGLVVLAAAHRDDTESNAKKLADRIWGLRIFNDEEGKMNLSLATVLSEMESAKANVLPGILCISNFTVYGETAKNRRPSFVESAPFEQGESLFKCLIEELQKLCPNVQTGVFGADMQVSLINDGPVTVIVEG